MKEKRTRVLVIIAIIMLLLGILFAIFLLLSGNGSPDSTDAPEQSTGGNSEPSSPTIGEFAFYRCSALRDHSAKRYPDRSASL